MSRKVRPLRLFLTDDRLTPEAVLAIVRGLPDDVDIVVRSRTPARRRLLMALLGPHRRGRRLILAASPAEAMRLRADGIHLASASARTGRPRPPRALLVTAAAHNQAQLTAARRTGAAYVLLSPIFATRSHPGAHGLGPLKLGLLIRAARGPRGAALLALGGMTPVRWRRLAPLRHALAGWAAINYWVEPESRDRL